MNYITASHIEITAERLSPELEYRVVRDAATGDCSIEVYHRGYGPAPLFVIHEATTEFGVSAPSTEDVWCDGPDPSVEAPDARDLPSLTPVADHYERFPFSYHSGE
jgi:hypothetical protein